MNSQNLPCHIAIIMDGNGRWALQRGLPRISGHQAGVESIRDIIRSSAGLGIQYLTLYAFSTENWARPKSEVSFLMGLLGAYLDSEIDELNKNNIRFNTIGRIMDLPDSIQEKIKNAAAKTAANTGMTLTLALSYSSRIEITDAVKSIVRKIQAGELDLSRLTPELISEHLYTAQLPDPDLLIRTSGELRLSNFLLWQLSYAELYVTEKLWPDFRRDDLLQAIDDYQKRERRFGKTEITAS